MVWNAESIPNRRVRGGEVTWIDKSVFWTDKQFQYGFGGGLRDKRIGGNEEGIFEIDENSGSKETKCDWDGDCPSVRFVNLWIRCFCSFLFWEIGGGKSNAKVTDGNEAIYECIFKRGRAISLAMAIFPMALICLRS